MMERSTILSIVMAVVVFVLGVVSFGFAAKEGDADGKRKAMVLIVVSIIAIVISCVLHLLTQIVM